MFSSDKPNDDPDKEIPASPREAIGFEEEKANPKSPDEDKTI